LTGPFLTLQERRVLALALALLALGYGFDGWRRMQAPELPLAPDSLDAALSILGARLADEPAAPLAAPAGPLDLNSATREQLTTLPGIGPARAEAILALRERRGRLGSVEELLDVRGIGPATLARLRPLLETGGAAPADPGPPRIDGQPSATPAGGAN